jgi:DNA-binding GntR family transcriptional regulator
MKREGMVAKEAQSLGLVRRKDGTVSALRDGNLTAHGRARSALGKDPSIPSPRKPPKTGRTRGETKSDQAYNVIREKIISLQFAPGAWFQERQIAAEMGLSAMPLREAIDRLEQEGLVRTVPRRGTQVTAVTAKYVRDFFDAWAPIVAIIFKLACTRATEEQLVEVTRLMVQSMADMSKSRPGETDFLIRDSRAIFALIVISADNEHLTAIWRRLSGIMERIFFMAFKQDPATGRMIAQIADQVDAWRSRDPDKVVRTAEKYVASARTAVLRLL